MTENNFAVIMDFYFKSDVTAGVIMTRAGLPFTYTNKHVGVLTWKEEYLGCTRKILLGSRNPEWHHDLPTAF